MPPGTVIARPLPPDKDPDPQLVRELADDLPGASRTPVYWRGIFHWVFKDVAGVERVFGPLTDEQRRTLASGRPLRGVEGSLAPGDGEHLSLGSEWMAIRTVRVGERPERSDSHLVFSGLNEQEQQLAARWANEHGITEAVLWIPSRARPLPISGSVQWATLLFSLVVAGLGLSSMRAVAESLRPLWAAVLALGLGRPWLRGVLWRVAGLLSGVAVAGAAMGAGLALMLCGRTLPSGLHLAGVPWLAVALSLASIPVGLLLGGAVAARGLHARERQT